MTPSWFPARRFGVAVQLSIATVPGFAPVGGQAADYRRRWQGSETQPEVQAWHREHHPDVAVLDDFLPALTLDRFDADDLADLAVEAGARYLLAVSRDRDGLCWWDSAVTDRTSARLGPKRDVVAELCDAARHRDLAFGLVHSLAGEPGEDGSHRRRRAEEAEAQVAELADRFRPDLLLVDHGTGDVDPATVVQRHRSRMTQLGLPAKVGAGAGAGVPDPDLATYDELPRVAPSGPWQLRRSLSRSVGFNRAERSVDHLSAFDIVDLLTEVVAKDGNLVLDLAPRPDGTVPDEQAGPLSEAGRWIRANPDLVADSRPFDVWGDDEVRYSRGPDDEVRVVDLRSLPRRSIAHLSPHRYPVEAASGAETWSQDAGGLHVEPSPGPAGDPPSPAHVYRVRLRARTRATLAVRGEAGPGPVTIGTRRFGTAAEALAAAHPGDVVQLGPGRQGVDGPSLVVPAGVTLSGAGEPTVIDGGRAAPGVAVVRLDSHGAAIERLCVVASAWPDGRPGTAITVAGDRARVEGCRVDGAVEVTDGHDVEIVWNVVTAGGLSVSGAERTTVRGNRLDDRRAAVAIDLAGGHGHRVEANTVPDAHDGIRLRDCHGASVSANQVTGRRSAVHLDRCTACRITGNRATGMRAFSVSGGVANELTANVADGTDTGVLLERGAADTEISANHLTGCRVAILAWSHQGTSIGANRITASRDHDLVDGSGVGPDDGTAS